MSIFYALTHSKWMKNKENGFENYIIHQELKATGKILKKASFINSFKKVFLSQADNVNFSGKRDDYKIARLSFSLLVFLLIVLVIAESIINFLTMIIVIMPGETSIWSFLARLATALSLTIISIVLSDFCFSALMHQGTEEFKIKYGISSHLNLNKTSSLANRRFDTSRLVKFIISFLLLVAVLYAIFHFAQLRAKVLEGFSEENGSISPMTILSLFLPLAGGFIMVFITRNFLLIKSYLGSKRYDSISNQEKNKEHQSNKQFNIKQTETIKRILTRTLKNINCFKNHLENRNKKILTEEKRYNTNSAKFIREYREFELNIQKIYLGGLKD